MKVRLPLPVFLGAAACLGVGLSGAQGGGLMAVGPPAVGLRPAVVLSMPLEAGLRYQLQASADLQFWSDLGFSLQGKGSVWEQSLALGDLPFFRLKVLGQGASAWAPETPAGLAWQCNEGPQVIRAVFGEKAAGTWQVGEASTPCLWTWQRSGPDQGRAELRLAEGVREVLQFTFTAPAAGQFTRQSFRGTQLEETSAGSFGPAPAPGAALAVPSSMAQRALALGDLPDGSSLIFAEAGGGRRLLAGQQTPFAGSWVVTGSHTAQLLAHFGPNRVESYQFTFTAPQAGRFTRETFSEGLLRDLDEGPFCLDAPP